MLNWGYMRDLNRVLGSHHLKLANFCGPFSDIYIPINSKIQKSL